MNLNHADEAEAEQERHAEPSRTGSAAKPDKSRKETAKLDPERLMKAIRYLKEHRER
jgi:hypothetical protein